MPEEYHPQSYVKAEGIEQIRRKKPMRLDLMDRIDRLGRSLSSCGKSAAQIAVVKAACDQVLSGAGPFTLREHVREEMDRLPDEALFRFLFYRYRYDVYPLQARVDDFPPCLQIEPTSVCNYRCVFCYQTDASYFSSRSGAMGSMSLDLFRRIVDEAQGRCEAVTLASRGEPLLCRDIEPMLAYMAGKFLASKINTNAFLLDERKAHALLSADLGTIVFSADAAEEPLYSSLRVHGSLDRVVSNLRRFQEIRARHYSGSRTIMRVSGVHVNAGQSLDAMEIFWGELVDQVAFVGYNPWENAYDRTPNGMETPCSDLWRRLFVWWNGEANPCDVDYRSTLTVGRVPEQGIGTIWTGAVYADHRRRHLAKERQGMIPCRGCAVV